MKFSETVGQHSVISKLVNSVDKGRISHAQLFFAKEGSGALPLALAYIQYIACPNRADGDSCGECNTCKKLSSFSHPDLHFAFPIISSTKALDSDYFIAQWRAIAKVSTYFSPTDWKEKIGAEKKQLNIPVKESDRISKKLSLKSYEGGYKFMVIWLAEYMKAPTANKLLKLLEEPPKKTLIILITNNFENILGTILSRTQLVKLNIPQDEEIADYLVANYGINSTSAGDAARLADGNVSQAVHIAKNENPDASNLETFSSLMRFAYKKDIVGAINWADKLHSCGREELKHFLTYSLHIVRQCIVGNYAGAEVRKLNESENDFAAKFAPFINHSNVVQVYEHLSEAESDIARNGSAKIILLDMAIQLFKLVNPKR